MMKAIKPFNTRFRRFSAGDEVKPEDDLSPHTIDSLKAAGLLADPETKSPPRGKRS